MQLRDRFKKQRRGRFERLKIIFPNPSGRMDPVDLNTGRFLHDPDKDS